MAQRLPNLTAFLFTTFLAPDAFLGEPYRQPDGVVTHADRPPYHRSAHSVAAAVTAAGLFPRFSDQRLPRGQVLCIATRGPDSGGESPRTGQANR